MDNQQSQLNEIVCSERKLEQIENELMKIAQTFQNKYPAFFQKFTSSGYDWSSIDSILDEVDPFDVFEASVNDLYLVKKSPTCSDSETHAFRYYVSYLTDKECLTVINFKFNTLNNKYFTIEISVNYEDKRKKVSRVGYIGDIKLHSQSFTIEWIENYEDQFIYFIDKIYADFNKRVLY